MFHRRLPLAALAALVLVAAGSLATLAAQGRGGGGGGKPGITVIPTMATFADEAIRVADGGPLLDGEDGVSSERVAGPAIR
jgi:hypothetical protein